jgi:hypothetical protein
MSGYGEAHPATPHGHARSPISVGWVVVAAVLMGVGIFMLAYFLLTFNLLLFLGILPCVIGGLMLFSPRAGLDRA